MQSFNRLIIDCNAIQTNVNVIASLHPSPFRLMPMVKGEGYGTNAYLLAQFLTQKCGIDIIGVSHVSEAIDLRKKGIEIPIFVIGSNLLEAREIVEYNLEPSVDSIELCQELEKQAAKLRKTVKIHLHLDTGIKRMGCLPEQMIQLAVELGKFPSLSFEGLYTHFVGSENQRFDSCSLMQIKALEEITKKLSAFHRFPKFIHLSNSSGLLRFKTPLCNMARTGIALFGIISSQAEKAAPLVPALKLQSTIIGLSTLSKGETAGYLHSYKAQREREKIAILPLGYYDGLHLSYSNKGYVLIRGKKARMVGKIYMDFMMIDVTDIPEAKIGDTVLVFGIDPTHGNLPVEIVSQWGTSNVRELISCLGPRITREFIYQDAPYDPRSNKLRKAVCPF